MLSRLPTQLRSGAREASKLPQRSKRHRPPEQDLSGSHAPFQSTLARFMLILTRCLAHSWPELRYRGTRQIATARSVLQRMGSRRNLLHTKAAEHALDVALYAFLTTPVNWTEKLVTDLARGL